MLIEEKNSGCEGRSGPAADTKSAKGVILHNEPGIVKELAKMKLSRLPASPVGWSPANAGIYENEALYL